MFLLPYALKYFEMYDVKKGKKFFVGQNLRHLVETSSFSVEKAFADKVSIIVKLSILDIYIRPEYASEAMKTTPQNLKC